MKYDFDLHMENENSLSLLLQNITAGATVLEFGPASGRMTRYMKEELNCKVYLVELDEEAGQKALEYGQALVTGDIENYVWLLEFKDIKFDHIIFADVLEHLRNPLEVLQSAKELLADNGTILLSVPNLAHNSVIIDLMNNKFQYQSTGLLDDTHIHFFTKTSLEKMVTDAKLFVQKKMATYAPVGSIEIDNSIHDVRGISAAYWNLRKYGEVYQYVYVLSQEQQSLVEEPLETRAYYCLEAYFDKDEMWSAEHKTQYPIYLEKETQKFCIELEECYKSVRIDPINANCIIEVQEAIGITEQGFEKLELKAYNAKACYEQKMIFDTDDPMIIYNIPENVKKIEITIKFLSVDFECNDLLVSYYENALRDLLQTENELEIQKKQIDEQHYVIEKTRISLEHANARLKRIEESIFYKVYKFLFKR